MSKISGIFNFKENHFFSESSVQHRTNNKLKIIADAVLTNRTELFIKFGVSAFERKNICDKELILKAYEKWGENCVEYLVGNFAFAIWDENKKKLFCTRDHFGNSTFFYYINSEQFIFASNPDGILKFNIVEKKFNKNKLAIFLLPEPHTYLTDESWFEKILPFPSGTSFTIDRNGIRSRKYWTPELQKELPYKNDNEILEAFREIFFEIIESYLGDNSSVASLLSGGLDSSSIVSVAAKILEKQNKELNVFAGVLADKNDKKFTDERFFINQFKSFPNIKINYISVPEAGPFSDLEELFEHFDSPFVTSRQYLYTAFNKESHKIGANTLFDGAFGETGATFHGTGGFAELFAKFKWKTLLSELKLREELYGDPIKYNIRANVINPLLPQFLINLRHGKFQDKTSLSEFHFLNVDLAQSLLKDVTIEKYVRQRIAPSTQINQINEISFVQKKLADMPSLSIGKFPVELRYPFLDKRLIEFTLGIPLHLKIKDGYYRYLIRNALDGILPPEIQWRTSKTPFSPDYVRRFNSQITNVRDLLADINSNDPIREILDIEKIKKWANLPIDDTERYTTNEKIAREQIPQAVYLIYFMRKFSEFR